MRFSIYTLGLIDYTSAWRFQQKVCFRVAADELDAGLILCRHHPVITIGRAGRMNNIITSFQELRARGISVQGTNRGGDVTYHGPGQLMVYPVFNLTLFRKDVHWFLRRLESTAMRFLAAFGVHGSRCDGLTGVWIDGRKIASIGVAVRNWISYHGMSVNVTRAGLADFGCIRPCGMDIHMVSMEDITGQQYPESTLEKMMLRAVQEEFEINMEALL